MPAPAALLQDVSKSYRIAGREVLALDHATLALPSGQVIGVLGRNGAGKSTLLRLLLGLQKATAGNIQRNAPTGFSWLPDHSVLDERLKPEVYLPLLVPKRHDAALAIARDFGVEDCFARRSGRLSAGQRRLCELALTLAVAADVFVLDEPLLHVSPLEFTAFRRVIRGLTATGKTVVVSTHELKELDGLFDFIVLLERGQILAAETPERLAAARLAGVAGAPSLEVLLTDYLLAAREPALPAREVGT